MRTALEVPTLPDLLAARAAAEPGNVAMIVHGSGGLAFGEWEERSNAVANALLARGVGRGDRVGLVFPGAGWIDYAVAFLGVMKAGAVAVPLSDRMPAAEIGQIASHCSTSWIITDLRELPRGTAEPPGVPLEPDAVAQILYTSGTTGKAKGVAATHANLAFGAQRQPRRRIFAHSRHLVHAFPIGTNAGQMMLVSALNAHPAVVTLPRFTPGRFARLIEKYRAGTVFLVPAMAIELLNNQENHDMSSVLLLGSASDVFRNGWIRMGDLGYLDEDGYLYLVDRESDVVKSGAFKVSTLKVSTLKVEDALHGHPAVVEAAAYGIPHPVLGTAVAAAVVLRDEASPAQLRAFIGERLAQHEIPSEILTLDALPRNHGGKVDKRALRARP